MLSTTILIYCQNIDCIYFLKYKLSLNEQQFYQYADVLSNFPLTIICSFNPFETTNESLNNLNRVIRDQNGNAIKLQNGQIMNDSSKITKFCLLYWTKNKKWIIHKNILNPKYQIITNDSNRTSLFGKYSLQNSFGLKQKQIMFIVAYFETKLITIDYSS